MQNVSFDSEIALAFGIQLLKVAFFFLNVNFSKYSHAEKVKNVKKMKFFEPSLSFPNEIDKKEPIQIIYSMIINPLRPATCWQQRHCGLYGGGKPPAVF